jgi:hypothetical protein
MEEMIIEVLISQASRESFSKLGKEYGVGATRISQIVSKGQRIWAYRKSYGVQLKVGNLFPVWYKTDNLGDDGQYMAKILGLKESFDDLPYINTLYLEAFGEFSRAKDGVIEILLRRHVSPT